MTTIKNIEYTLSYITVEAYMAGLDADTMPLHFVPGDKKNGNSPKIRKADGTMPVYLPQLVLGDSNVMVMKKLDASLAVFYALRQQRQASSTRNQFGIEKTIGEPAVTHAHSFKPYGSIDEAQKDMHNYLKSSITGRVVSRGIVPMPWYTVIKAEDNPWSYNAQLGKWEKSLKKV